MAYFNSADLVNELYKEITGNDDITTVDNSNIIDIKKTLQSITSADNLYNKIFNKVGMTYIQNKAYKGDFKNLYKTATTFGSIIEFIRIKPFVAVADVSRNPTTGKYDDFLNYAPASVKVGYVESESGWKVRRWLPTDQLWTAFNSLQEMDKFLAGIEIEVENAIETRMEAMASDALANMIAETAYFAFPDGTYDDDSKPTCQNVRHLFNSAHPDHTLTVEQCMAMEDEEFVKFYTRLVLDTRKRLTKISKIYNIEGEDTFTRPEDIQLTMLDPINNAMSVNIYSSLFHKELLSLGTYNTVAYWQGSGTGYDQGSISEINCKIKAPDGTTPTVEFTGILGVMYDKEAVMCFNEHKKSTSFYHPDLDQTLVQTMMRSGWANITDKNFVVFYVA